MTGEPGRRRPLVAEFDLLARLRPLASGDAPGIPLGVGDDAAVIVVAGAPVAIATDAVVAGVHADLEISAPADIGWKSVAVNVSDLAAIGAATVAAVVAVQFPDDLGEEEIVDLHRGMEQAATRWSLRLVGGDLVSAPNLAIVVSVVGELHGEAPLRRDAAQVGDDIVLIGRLGLGSSGLALHRAGATEVLATHPELLAVHRRPVAHPDGGRALVAAGAHACIDVSDGLGRDAGHVAAASGVHLHIEERALPIPAGVRAAQQHLGDDLLAVSGGEDLALLATLPTERLEDLDRELDGTGIRWARIGHVEAGAGVTLARDDGSEVGIDRAGWEHGLADT